MMTFFQAIILAIVQGITEPFPVSSLGHAVLLPGILHWPLDEHSSFFLPFLTMLHVGTLIALAQVFWSDWRGIFRGLSGQAGAHAHHASRHLCMRLMVGTIPAVIIGGLCEHFLRSIFANPLIVAIFLILNGLLLIITDKRRQHIQPTIHHLSEISFRDAVIVGCWQCLALFPGLSRSGATINGGLIQKFSPLTAARFSLLLAQPIILAATVKEAWQLRHVSFTAPMVTQAFMGAIIAGITALICSRLLLRFLHRSDSHALAPFGMYCILAGCGSILWLLH